MKKDSTDNKLKTMNKKNRSNNNKGFALLEVMVAALAMMLILTALLDLFNQSGRMRGQSEQRTAALEAAQYLLESNKAAGLDYLLEQKDSGLLGDENAPLSFTSAGTDYSYVLQLENVDLGDSAGSMGIMGAEMTVIVRFEGISGEGDIRLSTILTNRTYY